jgi:hypothetical protein
MQIKSKKMQLSEKDAQELTISTSFGSDVFLSMIFIGMVSHVFLVNL